MSSKLNVESFVAVLKKSGLIDADRLQRLVADFTAQGGSPDDSQRLAEFLVANNAITRWQSEKLLQGKHKGYFLGKYRLLSLLGKGGMSSVYLAEHVLMRRRCALKVLPTKRVNDSSYLARFHREAQAVASLDHPNIVRAYDVDHQAERETEIHFLVMEYVEGFSLQEIVQKNGFCSFLDAAEYTRQAALGLQHAHAAGMVHRDVKPGNLLVDPNGVVKVLDLGLARFFTGDEGEDALTIRHDEKVLGTADYLAPEQALDSHTVDARADIYSLGCTMYFMLTGRPPFTEGTLAQRLMAHQTKNPPTIESLRPETPSSLGNIVRKMMSKKPEERYSTAKETADVLFAWIDANADSEWRKGHSGVFGTRAADASAERASVPVAKPLMAMPINAAPVAPVIATGQSAQFVPPSTNLAVDTAPVVDPNLNSFFAALSGSQSASATKPAVAESKPIPVQPVAAAVVPKPVAPPALVVAAPVHPTPKPQSSKKLKGSSIASAAFPSIGDFPDFGVQPATPQQSSTKPAKATATANLSAKISQLQKQLPAFRRPSMPVLAGIGGGAFLLLLMIVVFSMGWMGGGETKKPDVEVQTPWPTDKREVTVGEGGEYKTIEAALRAVRRRYEPSGSPSDQMVLKIAAGTYRENISVDGTVKRARTRGKKPEKPTEPEWPQGIKLVADGEVVIEGAPDGPAIRLKNIARFVIEGVTVKVASQPIAVEVVGDLNDSRLVGLKVSGFTQTGIACVGARGISFGNGQFVLEKLTFEPAAGANGAAGIRMQHADDGDTSDTIVRGCRFLGPLAAGVSVTGTGPYRLIIAENIFAKTPDGIRFEGDVQWKDNAVLNNSFYECRNGILFTNMPADGSRGLSFRRNLFSKITTAEGVVQAGYDETRFAAVLSAAPPGVEFNYSDRPKPATPATGEINMLCEANGKRGETGFAFASTDAADKKFLAPTSSSVQQNVGGAAEGEKNWVGAIGLK